MLLNLSLSHSVHRGVSASVHAGISPPPWADTPEKDTPLANTSRQTIPCPVHAGIDMATAADRMHPTGMHSYL